MENKKLEPYSIFFSMGLLSSLFGVLLWLGFQTRFISFFPRQAHGNLMFFSFIWSYVAGFLMTAIPKMTRTESPKTIELFFAIFMVILQWVFNLRNETLLSIYLYVIQILFLLFFLLRRIRHRQQIPFEGFIFIPFAFLSAFVGAWIFISSQNQNFQHFYLFSGQAFILNLICGLGSRLIPVITRVPASIPPDVNTVKTKYLEFFILAALLNSSFYLEFLINPQLGNFLKAFTLVIIAIKHFKLLKLPTTRSFLGWGIRGSVSLMILGYVGLGMTTKIPLPILHLVYIGGFALITLMISMRVTLAHGPKDMTPELNSKAIVMTFIFFILAAFSRVLAGTSLNSLFLSLSIFLFIAALLTWSIRFLKALLRFSS